MNKYRNKFKGGKEGWLANGGQGIKEVESDKEAKASIINSGAKSKPAKPIWPARLNLVKIITQELIDHSDKLARGNWVLRNGKNKYRKVIEPTRPYQLWAADWKEFKLPLGVTIYIFVIIDCYTRQLVGYAIAINKDANIALKAARMAINNCQDDPLFDPRRLIIHSDQGGAYLDQERQDYWRGLGVKVSYADPGKPTQNPYIEAFFSVLRRFWLDQHEWTTITQSELLLIKFFDLYNREWQHSSIDYMTPDQRLEFYRTNANHILN